MVSLVKFMRSAARILFVLLFLLSPFAWILRDGMGPSAKDSEGFLALKNAFFTFYWGPNILIALSVNFLCSVYLYRKANKPPLNSENPLV